MPEPSGAGDWPLYFYRGYLERVVDGDTIHASLDLGLRTYRHVTLRIWGLDAPELFSGTDRVAGAASRDHLAALLAQAKDGLLYVRTERDRKSFDRYVASIFYETAGGGWIDVTERMIRDGYGVAEQG